ncbi:MAG: phosphoribosylpyrophosphate synthetase [Ginsengibacter sp.]
MLLSWKLPVKQYNNSRFYIEKYLQFECFIFDKNIFMESYDTVVKALEGLKKRGFKTDFNIAFDKITCKETNVCLNPNEFEITEVYRFEGETDPSDEAVVYAVESKSKEMKGVLVNAYGVYADPMSDSMIKKLSMHRKI